MPPEWHFTVIVHLEGMANYPDQLLMKDAKIIETSEQNFEIYQDLSYIPENSELTKEDKDIIKKLDKLIENVTKDIDTYNLHLAIEAIYDFVWHQLADVYIESSKDRRPNAQHILEHVFKTCLELLHPFMPFITEELWKNLVQSNLVEYRDEAKFVMQAKWPEPKAS
jgi:valyl-tRNA synthetase